MPVQTPSRHPPSAVDAVFRALADPGRRALIERIGGGEASVAELTAELGLSQPAVSQHLRTLREAGLVRVRADGRHRRYALEPARLALASAWLERQGRFWDGALAALGRHLDGRH